MTKIFPITRFTIHGNSMFPTLKEGQDILSFNWAYLFSRPKKGDLIVIEHKGKAMVKRVQKSSDRGMFAIGDNRQESTDSRHFGLIKDDQIIGKVIYS